MIARLTLAAMALALVAIASPAAARDTRDLFRPIRAGEPITIRPDKAYLLIRIGRLGTTQDPVILREPDPAESAAYETAKAAAFAKKGSKGDVAAFVFDYDGPSNLFILSHGKSIAGDKAEAMVLAEVRSGNYVLYGQGYGSVLYQCHCLGTVGFNAPPGVVTDLGTYLSDNASKPSVYPQLAGETNIGPTARMDFVLFAGGLIPTAVNAALPPGVDRAVVKAAAFHAIGPFVDPNVMHIDRLAAIPGVLAYDGGRVVDVASGKEAMPR
jgi:hypothetical protein